ncbi:hypothetical protein [Paraflavitalea speifideaquila]|uniref:hypothetical protein n=1 Tax=Paraflavitalea speifideaquila TaxID=3076558 RepID=UPI0028E1F0EF|nr:hypothetical protein [Paraflavitalea speifideiaquila]
MGSKYAAAWQLKKIDLPSGGAIQVTYEADDYAYVQDKRAAQMCFVSGVGSPGSSGGLVEADHIYVTLPRPVSNEQEMRFRYFREGNKDMENLYFKFLWMLMEKVIKSLCLAMHL